MARGWESKSVEDQIELAEARRAEKHAKQVTADETDALRKREGLLLTRKRVERELAAAQNPRYQAVLTKALSDLDAQLSQLELPAGS